MSRAIWLYSAAHLCAQEWGEDPEMVRRDLRLAYSNGRIGGAQLIKRLPVLSIPDFRNWCLMNGRTIPPLLAEDATIGQGEVVGAALAVAAQPEEKRAEFQAYAMALIGAEV